MKCAGERAVALAEPALRRERRPVEAETEDLGFARRCLRFDPGPGRMDDGEIAAQGPRGRLLGFGRSRRIEAQRILLPAAKDLAHETHIRALGRLALQQGEVEALVPVPAGHQRDVRLFPRSEDRGRRFREKMPVDDRPVAEARRGGEDGFRGRLAQLLEIRRADLAHEGDPRGLRFCERGGDRLGVANIAPLSPIARTKRPLASGEAISALTASEPADLPTIVTLSGSPPKAAMLRFTQYNAATTSSMP